MKFSISIVLLFILVVACNVKKQSDDPAAVKNSGSSMKKSHFVDSLGNNTERHELFYDKLAKLFGAKVPSLIKIEYIEGENSYFDTENNRVLIGNPKRAAIAHESCHLTLAFFTNGVSNTPPFRFIDEGLCHIFGKDVDGDNLADYRKQSMKIAAGRLKKGQVSFAQVQNWGVYFDLHMDWTSYDVGSTFIYYFQEKYGEKSFVKLLEQIGITNDLDSALKNVTGKSSVDIEKEWLGFLSTVSIDQKEFSDPEIVSLFPMNNAVDVDPEIKEMIITFNVDMNTNVICITTGCNDDICYTNAKWKDSRKLIIEIPKKLKSETQYKLLVGNLFDKCTVTSAHGSMLIPVEWKFRTMKKESL